MNAKKKKDIRLLVCLSVVAFLGMLAILIKGNFILLALYVPLICVALLALYFNYSLCKLENKWRSLWNDRNPGDCEPSDFHLITSKVGDWLAFAADISAAHCDLRGFSRFY